MAYSKVQYQGKEFSIATEMRSGQEHLIVFLHGLGCAKESFEGAFQHKGLEPFSIMTCDFIGFGTSDKPSDFPYKLEDQASVVSLLLEELNPKKVSIIGHSMGGAIGLLIAEELKNLVNFISIEGNLVAEDCGLVSRGIANQTTEQFQLNGYAEFLDKLQGSTRSDFKKWSEWYAQSSPLGLHASAKSLVEWSDSGKLLEIFNGLSNKVYIYGDEDSKDYLLPQLQNARTVEISAAGHFSMVNNPDILYDKIASILSK
jgi:pimeloyl-ACP methyl ester carboxylesterase